MWGLTPKKTRHKYLKAAEGKCIQLKENTVTALSLSDGRRLMNTLFASANVISLIRFAQRVVCWLTWRWTMSHWLMLLPFDPFCFHLLPASERLERASRKGRCVWGDAADVSNLGFNATCMIFWILGALFFFYIKSKIWSCCLWNSHLWALFA